MDGSEQAVIVARGVAKSFGEERVLAGVDLEVERGTLLALLGPNGAGKTTTVRILATLTSADEGTVTIGGYDVRREADRVRGLIGLTGQFAAVDDLLTGRENLVMVARLLHLRRAEAKARAEELLAQFELTEAADRPAKTYSGGMRRRLDLALSLVAAPPVLFLDEPSSGLDPRSRQALWESIRQLLRTGTTVLLTTQYLEEADQLADRVAVIDEGRIIVEGTAAELKRRVGEDRLELVLHDEQDLARAASVLSNAPVATDRRARRVTVPVAGPDAVRESLNRLARAEVVVDQVSLSKPTLDDVFLAVTGVAKFQTPDEEGAAA